MSTSSCLTVSKKIKPVEHPSLVLKSPIAYHGDTDLSVIPINKDGIAVCEKCGAIGVKHAFYTKERRFCSLVCARSYNGLCKDNIGNDNTDNLEDSQHTSPKKQINYKYKFLDSTEHLIGMIPMEPLPQLPGMWQQAIDDFMQPLQRKFNNPSNSYDWLNELQSSDFVAAPVKLFVHAPLSDMWDNTFIGMKVEVKNRDCDNYSYKLSDYFWVATVLKLKGYMGLLRYEGFGNDDSKDFWINLMYSEVHPVGWCATRGKPLIPPQSIENKYSDWKAFLVQQLTGARTLPTDFYNKVNESMKSRFRVGHILEVNDKNRLCHVKLATVHQIVGKRLHIKYYDSTSEDNGFWCHEDCPLLHPVGWAHEVGHMLDAPPGYLERLKHKIGDQDDATPDLFKKYIKEDPHNINFQPNFIESMKLEAIDPLNLSAICVATVMKVLSYGYIMIRIDCYPPDESGSDWFCYHQNSPYIFPAGFCKERGIPFTSSDGQVSINTLMNSNDNGGFQHGFVPGMRLECADLMAPQLVCVATVAGVIGRLIKVHFNGWSDEYDQWLDCESTDIYPVGWCQAVGYKLEGPFGPSRQPPVQPRKKGRKKKGSKNHLHQTKPNNNSELTCDVPNSNESMYDVNFQMKIEDDMETSCSQTNGSPKMLSEELYGPKLEDLDDLTGNRTDFDMDVDEKPYVMENDSIESEDNNAREMSNNQINTQTEEPRIQKTIPQVSSVDMKAMETIDPLTWDSQDVAQFLTVNDCAPYCLNFSNIDGKMLLDLTKDEIIELLEMKVGPSLKIYDLIQQLKCKLKPVHIRNKIFK